MYIHTTISQELGPVKEISGCSQELDPVNGFTDCSQDLAPVKRFSGCSQELGPVKCIIVSPQVATMIFSLLILHTRGQQGIVLQDHVLSSNKRGLYMYYNA